MRIPSINKSSLICVCVHRNSIQPTNQKIVKSLMHPDVIVGHGKLVMDNKEESDDETPVGIVEGF